MVCYVVHSNSRIWVLAFFDPLKYIYKMKFIMQLFSADATMYKKFSAGVAALNGQKTEIQ